MNAGRPYSGSKVWKTADREIGEPGENGEKVISYRDFQSAAAFHDRENCRNLRSRLSYKDFLTLWRDADPDIPLLEAGQGGVREVAVRVLKLPGWRFC
jgi:hypothetical protein